MPTLYLYPPRKRGSYSYRDLKDLWLDGVSFTDADGQEWTVNTVPEGREICLWDTTNNTKLRNPSPYPDKKKSSRPW